MDSNLPQSKRHNWQNRNTYCTLVSGSTTPPRKTNQVNQPCQEQLGNAGKNAKPPTSTARWSDHSRIMIATTSGCSPVDFDRWSPVAGSTFRLILMAAELTTWSLESHKKRRPTEEVERSKDLKKLPCQAGTLNRVLFCCRLLLNELLYQQSVHSTHLHFRNASHAVQNTDAVVYRDLLLQCPARKFIAHGQIGSCHRPDRLSNMPTVTVKIAGHLPAVLQAWPDPSITPASGRRSSSPWPGGSTARLGVPRHHCSMSPAYWSLRCQLLVFNPF